DPDALPLDDLESPAHNRLTADRGSPLQPHDQVVDDRHLAAETIRSGSGSSTSSVCDPPLLDTPLPSLLQVPIASVQSEPMPATIEASARSARPENDAGARGAPPWVRSNAASTPNKKSPRLGWALPPRYP